MPSKPSSGIQSLVRGLDILRILAEDERPVGVTEIAQSLNVDKSTAYRLVSTLASRGFVTQDADTRRYMPGLEIVHLSRRVLDRIELRSVARPWLEQLRRLTGESAHLALVVGNHAVYVDAVESQAALNVATEIGRSAPAHCTAIGKALIACLPSDELSSLIGEATLTRHTPRTIVNPRELAAHLDAVRERGYAVDDEEFDPGVRCVAAAIHDYRNKVIAVVGISGPAVRVTLERIPEIGANVVETAGEISRVLGHSKP